MAEIVSDNDELLTLILLRLPAKIIFRFKAVSKHWKALITDPYFMWNHFNIHQLNPSLLFIRYSSSSQPAGARFDFIPLDDDLAQVPPLFGTQTHTNLKIKQHCNGLLLCTTHSKDYKHTYHHVCNPTTNQFIKIPTEALPPEFKYQSWSFAFDPTRSPHYKIVNFLKFMSDQLIINRIAIYSSETRSWQVSEPISADYKCRPFTERVYSNGAVHWLELWKQDFIHKYFNIEEGRIGIMPTLPKLSYPLLKAWKEHLHLVNMCYHTDTKFEVYEIERDYTNWCTKYRVDFGHFASTFASSRFVYPLLIISGQREEDSYLILQFEYDALVRYNLVDKTFKKLPVSTRELRQGKISYLEPYIESLYSV